jgi:hypothetical protein
MLGVNKHLVFLGEGSGTFIHEDLGAELLAE